MPVEPSFPAIHTTGPVHIFARVPATAYYAPSEVAKIWYIGTCETQPQIKHQKQFLDVFNDISGRKVPAVQIAQGEIGLLGFMMTRFSHLGYDAIRRAGGPDGNATAPGAGIGYEAIYNRGSIVHARQSIELWLLYEFGFGALTPGAAQPPTTPGLPRGRYYPCAILGPHEIADSGTAAEKLLMVFNALPLYLGTGFAPGDPRRRGFALYSEKESDFPSEIVTGNVQ